MSDKYDDYEEEDYEDDDFDSEEEQKSGKKHYFLFLAVILIMTCAGGIYFGLSSKGGAFLNNIDIVGLIQSKITGQSVSSSSSESVSASSEDNSVTSAETESTAESNDSGSSVSEQSVERITFDNDSRSKFVMCENGFFYFSRDGARFYESVDQQVWNDTYSMSSINVSSNGDYAVVSDIQGRNIRVYNTSGLAFASQVDGNIVQCSVNAEGTCSVVEKTGNDYKVQVYRNDGSMLLERFDQDEGVYPISSVLSDDSRVLAVSYLDTSDIEMKTRILFFYVNKSDAKESDSGDFYAAVEKEDLIVPYIYYYDGDFIAVGDSCVFAIDDSGNEIWSTDIPNHIEYVGFTDNGNAVLALGEAIADMESYESGTVCMLGSNGGIKREYTAKADIIYFKVEGNSIVIGVGKEFTCLSDSLTERWSYTATQDIRDIIPYSGNNAVIVTNTDASFVNVGNRK